MKKIIFLLLAFTFLFRNLNSQNLPCKFSWDNVKTSNGDRNFTTTARAQIFNDPCLSFAYTSAIESMYKIENNLNNQPVNDLLLSVAWTDMKVFSEHFIDYKEVLNRSFKIPQTKEDLAEFMFNKFVPGVDTWNDPRYNNFRSRSTNCINLERDFILKKNSTHVKTVNKKDLNPSEITPIDTWDIQEECGDDINASNYLTVDNLEILNFSTINEIKEAIISNGPIVIKVINKYNEGEINISKFRNNYPIHELSGTRYHAYLVVGWEDIGNETSWRVKDSWMRMATYFNTNINTLSNQTLLNLINSNRIEFSQVNGIKRNGVGNNGENSFIVDRELQCPTIPTEIVLSTIDVELHNPVIAGLLYSEFFVMSENTTVDEWQWVFEDAVYTTGLVNTSNKSRILISPVTNGYVTMKVRARKGNLWSDWKTRTIVLANGSNPGMY